MRSSVQARAEDGTTSVGRRNPHVNGTVTRSVITRRGSCVIPRAAVVTSSSSRQRASLDGLGAPRQREYRNQADDVARSSQRQADDAHASSTQPVASSNRPASCSRPRRPLASKAGLRRAAAQDVDARQRRSLRWRLRHDAVSRAAMRSTTAAGSTASDQPGTARAANGSASSADEPGGPHGVARGRRPAHRDSRAQPRQRQDDGGTRDERGGLET